MLRPDDVTLASEHGPAPAAAAFTPGQVIAGRYRLLGLLGRGGMGDVYRADDLKLGTPVALKFLPARVEHDEAALRRFHDEVRIARQVSHPYVCRVFDIGEIEGRHFLSMEFVDGEDLASLLRRIGRLPPAKAIELSRQLCAGLSAAHQQGVLHRDLKPANVMVDGHGRARITDFGLAVVGSPASLEFAGTPAYMAPEQLAGQPASVQSDVYALGLVLYEMFTGARALVGTTVEEWRRVHAEEQPSLPSTRTSDMDPVVEQAILRCLEKNPADRPRSAAQVAMALPGGDPLAVAVAAGETPSPAMVAAAGGSGAMSPGRARMLLAATLIGLAGVVALTPYSSDLGVAPMRRSPDVLLDRAQAVVRDFGYDSIPRDDTSWIERDYDVLQWLATNVPSTEWRRRLPGIGSPVLFTYRRSAVGLRPQLPNGLVTPASPPAMNGSDDIRVVIDGDGRLRQFVATPPTWSDAPRTPVSMERVFTAASLDATRFSEVTPTFTPAVAFDVRREWTGTRGDLPELPLRLSVAWFEGRLVDVDVLGPWRRDVTPVLATSTSFVVQQAVFVLFVLGVLGTAAELARRNVLAGRGDHRGALRIAAGFALLSATTYVLTTHAVRGDLQGVLGAVFGVLGTSITTLALTWLLYMAVEPNARRHAPALLVGWTRLLDGRVRDPGVGRDILIGLTAGVGIAMLYHLTSALPALIEAASQTPLPGFSYVPRGGAEGSRIAPAAGIVSAIDSGLTQGLWMFTMVVAARVLWRPSVAMAASVVVFALLFLGGENPLLETPCAVAQGVAVAWAANRWGLLALIALHTTFRLLVYGATLSTDTSPWYAPYSWVTLAALLALAAWTFRLSAGSPVPLSPALRAPRQA